MANNPNAQNPKAQNPMTLVQNPQTEPQPNAPTANILSPGSLGSLVARRGRLVANARRLGLGVVPKGVPAGGSCLLEGADPQPPLAASWDSSGKILHAVCASASSEPLGRLCFLFAPPSARKFAQGFSVQAISVKAV